ncbi:hypothetical protein CK203_048180 [Vitis vinifera]|uniref:Reverse transcriptase zinc-binding domain-containing protein n=1 Tax=Vitis vinifera TaxID=29760 RepID=A0A438H461_VITVI|nr:hypothetical protein CK203_048180 [Vitis vinifera]
MRNRLILDFNRLLSPPLQARGSALSADGTGGQAFGWAVVEVESPSSLGLVGLEGVTSPGPSQVQLLDLLVKACPSAWQGLNNWNNLEAKFFKLWEMEVMRKQQIEDHQTATNRALVEEALRYGSVLNSWGKRASGSSPSGLLKGLPSRVQNLGRKKVGFEYLAFFFLLMMQLCSVKQREIGEVQELDVMAVEIGCRVGSLPSSYLGLPLGAPNKALSAWDGVEERVVARRLEKLQRDFLWGGGDLERKTHLVNWEVVCADKEKGILAKYGQEGFGWRTKKANGVFGVGVWKEILKEIEWCWENIVFIVGNGTKIRFWIDHWCGSTSLSQRFPQLFIMAAHRNATVEEMNLLHVLRGYRLTLEEDSVSWKGGSNGHFRVKEAYSLLVNPIDTVFPKNCIWVGRVPSKIAFFAWEATWGKTTSCTMLRGESYHVKISCYAPRLIPQTSNDPSSLKKSSLYNFTVGPYNLVKIQQKPFLTILEATRD